ncbi:uncharacterized protein LOC129583389 [Paramacrobiotus metropolitanus]|uniref:uncharacterized protein LOC129583389 n=1 Tax=Paramacrobiotus metropolitanus TaxID=2943436 RepID=UPI002445E4DE|nr:uncharacterized protein LOC129583389 [Paramacrobiotus metropolitanus]
MKSIFVVQIFSMCSLMNYVESGKARRHHFRDKRQILGDFIAARTTLTPYIDTDPQGGSWLESDQFQLTQAPMVDPFNPDASTTESPEEETEEEETTVTSAGGASGATRIRQGGPRITTTPRPTTTTSMVGYLVSSPYPYVPDMPDIPFFGSKFNGPWGFPLGLYQSFRGTGQYINHYNYYPLSYFGSALIPPRYGKG